MHVCEYCCEAIYMYELSRDQMIAEGVSLPVNVHDDESREWVLCTDSLVIEPASEPADVPDAEDYHWYTLNGEPRVVSMVRYDVEDFLSRGNG